LPDYDLTPTREVLRNYGNMSSPSVLFALESTLAHASPAAGAGPNLPYEL